MARSGRGSCSHWHHQVPSDASTNLKTIHYIQLYYSEEVLMRWWSVSTRYRIYGYRHPNGTAEPDGTKCTNEEVIVM